MHSTLLATPGTLAWLEAISLLAGLAKGLTGFGGALLMAPLFSLFLDAPAASVLIILVHCATAWQGVRTWRVQVRWKSVVPLAVVALCWTQIGVRCLRHTDPLLLRHLAAVTVLLMTVVYLRGWFWRHRGSWLPTFGAGAVSGMLTALGGLGGPPAVYYFSGLAAGQGNFSLVRPNLLAYFAILFSGTTLMLVGARQIGLAQLVNAALLIPGFGLGAWLGQRYHSTLPAQSMRLIVGSLLLASGLLALLA